MTYKHYNQAIEKPYNYDTGLQRFIFLESCYRSDTYGRIRYTQSEMASLYLVSIATVKRELQRLQEIGLIEKEAHGRYKVILIETAPIHAPTPVKHNHEFEDWLDAHEKEDKEHNIWFVTAEGEALPNCVKVALEERRLIKDHSAWTNQGERITLYKFSEQDDAPESESQ